MTWLFGEDGGAERRVADAVLVGGSYAEHVVLLGSVVVHRVPRATHVRRHLQPVLTGRTPALHHVVDLSQQGVVGQLARQPRQSAPRQQQ